MGLNKEDRILIKNLYLLKGYGAKRLMKKFPTKYWKKNYTGRFLEAITNHRFQGAQGRLRTVRTTENIEAVNELVLSQEDAPQSHHTTRQIVRVTRDKFIGSINVFSCTHRSRPTAAVVCYGATIAMETIFLKAIGAQLLSSFIFHVF